MIKGGLVEDNQRPAGYAYNRDQRFERFPTKKQFGVEDAVYIRFLRVSKTRVCPPMVLRDAGLVLPPQCSPLESDRLDFHFLGPNVTFVFPELKNSFGLYRLRVHASKGHASKEHPKLSVYGDPISYFLSPKFRRAGEPVLVDAPTGKPRTYEFYLHLDESAERATRIPGTQWLLGFLLRYEYFVPDNEKTLTPSLHIQRIELDGPYYENWPIPREQSLLLTRKEQESEAAHAKRIIDRFLTRAFRGDVN